MEKGTGSGVGVGGGVGSGVTMICISTSAAGVEGSGAGVLAAGAGAHPHRARPVRIAGRRMLHFVMLFLYERATGRFFFMIVLRFLKTWKRLFKGLRRLAQ